MEDLLIADFERIFEQSTESLSMLRGKRMLLTGGTGFFGKWILGFLNHANRYHQLELTVFVLSRNPRNFLKLFPQFSLPLIQFIEGDVRNFSFSEPVDFVIHAATEASAKLNDERPSEMFDVIVQGTKHLLEICRQVQPQRVMMTSSGAVYGNQAVNITHQDDEGVTGPDVHSVNSAYAEGKRVSELLGAFHANETGQEVNFARCYAFVGPYLPLDTHFAVGNFMNDCLQGRDIVIKGDGTACRSYQYASDLVVWLLKILTHGKNVRSYNVGSEESVTIADLAYQVSQVWSKLSGKTTMVRIEGVARAGAPTHRYVPRTKRAREELGLKLSVSLEESLLKTLTWNDCSD